MSRPRPLRDLDAADLIARLMCNTVAIAIVLRAPESFQRELEELTTEVCIRIAKLEIIQGGA